MLWQQVTPNQEYWSIMIEIESFFEALLLGYHHHSCKRYVAFLKTACMQMRAVTKCYLRACKLTKDWKFPVPAWKDACWTNKVLAMAPFCHTQWRHEKYFLKFWIEVFLSLVPICDDRVALHRLLFLFLITLYKIHRNLIFYIRRCVGRWWWWTDVMSAWFVEWILIR